MKTEKYSKNIFEKHYVMKCKFLNKLKFYKKSVCKGGERKKRETFEERWKYCGGGYVTPDR